MSEKESLLEKESRDDGKRVQQCSGSMDTLIRIERFSSILGFSGGILERKRHYFLERFSSILGRGITLVYGKIFQHISRRIFKRVLGNFGWRLLGKE